MTSLMRALQNTPSVAPLDCMVSVLQNVHGIQGLEVRDFNKDLPLDKSYEPTFVKDGEACRKTKKK